MTHNKKAGREISNSLKKFKTFKTFKKNKNKRKKIALDVENPKNFPNAKMILIAIFNCEDVWGSRATDMVNDSRG